jgi:hypothetical protein
MEAEVQEKRRKSLIYRISLFRQDLQDSQDHDVEKAS